MRSHVTASIFTLAAALACSGVAFAQVYGTDGGAPGAWPTKDLPKELSAPGPYDPHDLSGVWASPSEEEDAHWLGEHGGQGGSHGPPDLGGSPPFADWGPGPAQSHFPRPHRKHSAQMSGKTP